MSNNKVIIAAAGSGKTTLLVREASGISATERVLITTFTESNEAEIRSKFIELAGHVPKNVQIKTWFSLLIEHGVKPFQGAKFDFEVKGMKLVSAQSGFRYTNKAGFPVYWGEGDFEDYYFNSAGQIYSDKLSKLVVRLNEASGGNVVNRLARIFSHIYIDEVQDLAGYDLDIMLELFSSPISVLAVGDPRQVTYLTHHERKHSQYTDGKIVDFFREKLPKGVSCDIDESTLKTSHRNHGLICAYAARLYPSFPAPTPCTCCRKNDPQNCGLFVVRPNDVERYLQQFEPVQLRYSAATKVNDVVPVMNFGDSKGLGFDRVLIYPTKDMLSWLTNNGHKLKHQTRARFYVALTRARYSVAIVADLDDAKLFEGFMFFK